MGQQILPLTPAHTHPNTDICAFPSFSILSDSPPISHSKILTNQTLTDTVWPAPPAAANRLLPSNSNQSNQINKQHPHQTAGDDGRFFFSILKAPSFFQLFLRTVYTFMIITFIVVLLILPLISLPFPCH